jgi:hypothetical protein
MVEQARNGISINQLELSEVDQPTNPLKSTTLVNPITCNTIQPTQDGGKSGSTTVATLPMSETARESLSQEAQMLKLNQFGLTKSTEEDIQPKSGRLSTLTRWVMKLIKRRD